MTERIHDRLASRYADHSVVRCLHDVPPHEVYEVRVDGRRAVYKGGAGPTGRAATEGHVTAFVDEHTGVPVPTVRSVGGSWFLTEWTPAPPTPDADPGATDAWCSAAGRALARLHADSGPAVDGHGRPEPTGDGLGAPHDDWHAAAVAYLGARRRPLARYGHGDVVDAAVDALTDRPDAFAEAGSSQAFREGYGSVRSLPPGVTDRAPFFRLLCLVYYLESLHVQDRHGPDETGRRASGLRETTFELLAEIR